MTKYNKEKIYSNYIKDDKLCIVHLKKDSKSFKKYGESVVGVFSLTQKEREYFESQEASNYLEKNDENFKFQLYDYSEGDLKLEKLKKEGIDLIDISSIDGLNIPSDNLFYSKEKRKIKTHNIPINIEKNGDDYNWMYGLKKRLVLDGINLSPKDQDFYLACKLYFEEENLTEIEKIKLFHDSGEIKRNIEFELLKIKYHKKKLNDDEYDRLVVLVSDNKRENISLLDKYLKESGSSIKKLFVENEDKCLYLLSKLENFTERTLNPGSVNPIFIDKESFLHIYTRHVEDFKFNNHFQNKDNFQWDEENIKTVMTHVIEIINPQYQLFKSGNKDYRFSKYGSESIYFEGDYYTIHIEANGRVSTFHKNKKNI